MNASLFLLVSYLASACPYALSGNAEALCSETGAEVTPDVAITSKGSVCRATAPAHVRVTEAGLVATAEDGSPVEVLCVERLAIPERAPVEPAKPKRERQSVFVPEVKTTDIGASASQSLTRLVTAAAARRQELTVTSGDELKRMLEGEEVSKTKPGCVDEVVCLNELAGALGAKYLLVANAAQTGRTVRLSLQVLDAESADVVGRAEATAAGVFGFQPLLDDLVHNAFADVFGLKQKPIPQPKLSRLPGDEQSITGAAAVAAGAFLGGGLCALGTAGVCLPGTLLIITSPMWGATELLVQGFYMAGVPCTAALGAGAASFAIEEWLGFSGSWLRALLVAAISGVAAAVFTVGFPTAVATGYGILFEPNNNDVNTNIAVTIGLLTASIAAALAATAVVAAGTTVASLYFIEDEVALDGADTVVVDETPRVSMAAAQRY